MLVALRAPMPCPICQGPMQVREAHKPFGPGLTGCTVYFLYGCPTGDGGAGGVIPYDIFGCTCGGGERIPAPTE